MSVDAGKFQVMLGGEWLDYPANANKNIMDAYSNGEEKVEFKLKIDGREMGYSINFKTMKQTASYSSKERTVRAPFDMMGALAGLEAEKAAAILAAEDTGKFAGDDVKQEYKQDSNEDAKAKKKREDRKKGLELLKTLLDSTAQTKGWEEEALVEARAKCAEGARQCIKYGISEEEVRPLRDRVRKIHNAVQDLKGAIRVFARTRPFNQREIDTGSKRALKFSEDNMTVQVEDDNGNTANFMFDTTFNPGTQEAVFDELQPLIQSCYDGFNVTVFAYGQTGSGKTFTMYGPDNNRGVVMRGIEEIFKLKKEYEETSTVTITVSMIELYNGRFKDLLYKGKEKPAEIEIRKAPDGEVLAVGVGEIPSTDGKVVWNTIQTGFESRQVTATAMNSESSRSHLFTVLKIKVENKETKKVLKGKVTLVDLAGSEKVKDSMVEGDALKEAIEINKSLTTLGDVMTELSAGGKKANFRNTPLTNFLQDSLGGTAKTLMFANLSPAMINVSETKMTCAWAMRARKVVNDGGKKAAEASAKADAKAGAKSKAKAKPKAKK